MANESLTVSLETGLFGNRFEVSLEGDCLRFDFDEVAEDGGAPFPKLESSKVVRDFIGLVGCKEERGWIAQVEEGSPFPRRCGFQRMDDQYALRDESGEALLELAGEIGPLFGVYDFDHGLVRGLTVREPVDWWRSAAGTMGFALRLREASRNPRLLSTLRAEVQPSMVSYERARVCKLDYLNDLGFEGAYGDLLIAGDSEYHRAFPPTSSPAYGDGVFYRGGIEPVEGLGLEPSEPTFRKRGHRFGGAARRLFSALAPHGARAAEPSAGGSQVRIDYEGYIGYRIYLTRVEGENPAAPFGGNAEPYRHGPLPDGELLATTFPSLIDAPPADWSEMLGELYNTVVRLHIRQCSDEMNLDEDVFAFCKCALERMWRGFARECALNRVGICAYCGKPIAFAKGDRERKTCDDACRKGLERRKKEVARRFLMAVIVALPLGEPFSAKSLQANLGIKACDSDVARAVEALRRDGWEIREMPGRGKRYRVVARPARTEGD